MYVKSFSKIDIIKVLIRNTLIIKSQYDTDKQNLEKIIS